MNDVYQDLDTKQSMSLVYSPWFKTHTLKTIYGV